MEFNLEIIPQFGEAEMKTVEEKIWDLEVDAGVVMCYCNRKIYKGICKGICKICKESKYTILLFLKKLLDIPQN